jgi:hypothetical protein
MFVILATILCASIQTICFLEHILKINRISLIKIDIEGGEKIVVPALIDFLKIHKPVFYISLHRCFLREYDIEEIINILFGIYDTCYVFSDNGEKKIVDKNFIQKEALTSLVFE